jgi:hypothetical protein
MKRKVKFPFGEIRNTTFAESHLCENGSTHHPFCDPDKGSLIDNKSSACEATVERSANDIGTARK